jgi:chemotaxis-related protein WspB
MQALTFSAAGMHFALRLRDVVQVLPDCDTQPVPLAPAAIVGLIRWGVALIPVVDFGLLLGASPAATQRATRMIVVRVGLNDGTISSRLFAVRAEAVLDLIAIDACAPGIPGSVDSWLGQHIVSAKHVPQLIEIQHLLPVALHALYFDHSAHFSHTSSGPAPDLAPDLAPGTVDEPN